MTEPEQHITWPMAAVMIGMLLVCCIFVLGMNAIPFLVAGCR